jgi:hypothetical protein
MQPGVGNIATCKYTGPGAYTDGGGDKAVVEFDTLIGQPIQIRGLDGTVLTVTSKGLQSLVVGQYDQEVWLFFLFAVARKKQKGQKEKQDCIFHLLRIFKRLLPVV